MKLSELKTGETAVIVKIRGYGEFRHRITEMGFVKSKEVYVVKHAPLRDPIEYRVMGYDVSLRHTEADLIEVVKIDEPGYQQKAGQFEIIDREELKKGLVKKGKIFMSRLWAIQMLEKQLFLMRSVALTKRLATTVVLQLT